MKRSQTISNGLARMYAKMASAAARKALALAGEPEWQKEADALANSAARWLDLAGARATHLYFLL